MQWIALAIIVSTVLLIVDRNRKWNQLFRVLRVGAVILFGVVAVFVLDYYNISHWNALIVIGAAVLAWYGWKYALRELYR